MSVSFGRKNTKVGFFVDSGINAKLANTLQQLATDLTVTVGNGGDYNTINEALTALSVQHPKYKNQGYTVTIQLLSGFILKEQIVVDGIDLGWITITSQDPIVTIDRDSITQILLEGVRKPAFLGINNAVLPTIGCLFSYNAGTTNNTVADGIAVAFGSKVQLLPGTGVNNANRGLAAYYSSKAYCYMQGLTEGGAGTGAGTTKGVFFQNCTGRAMMATYGSQIHCARSQLQNCTGDYGVYCIWGSFCDIYQSDISGTINGSAVCSRDSSKVNARETHVSGSNIGYHALHDGEINARYHTNDWSQDGAKNCIQYGVLASYNSRIEASQLPVDGCKGIGVHASNGSTVAFYDNATATGCVRGIYATQGGTIDCANVDASNCSDIGIYSEHGSTVNANNSKATGCTNYGYQAAFCSRLNAEYSAADNSGTGFYAQRASTINARSSTAKTCSITGVYAFEASTIYAGYLDTTGLTGDFGFKVGRGSTISAQNATGTLSQTALSQTVNGIIYQ